MVADALRTLMHPFETGTLPPPPADGRVLFLGAEPGLRLPEDFPRDILAVQGFRPLFLGLRRQGIAVVPAAEGDGYDMALVLAGRHRAENANRIAEAIERTKPGALIVVAGSKDDGIAGTRRAASELVDVEGHMAKHHGTAFWLRRPADMAQAARALRQEGAAAPIEGKFRTAPGMFSHDRIDRGSALLAAHLPTDKLGKAADFCAGWGYLASELAAKGSAGAIDLYEADHASLEAAKANLAGFTSPPFRFFWHDLAAEPVAERYDTIVMNPPFHTGRAAEPGLGQKLIAAAAAALRPKGRLFLVANRGLPYDRPLAANFSASTDIASDGMFRVIVAIR